MSESKNRVTSTGILASVAAIGCLVAGQSYAGISGSGSQGISGSGSQGISGSGSQGISGSGSQGISGSGSQGISGSGSHGISGSGSQGISGSGSQGISGSGSQGISGSGDLVVIGVIEFHDGNFASILGQSVFSSSLGSSRFSVGDTVAVYGSIDKATGGIVDSVVVGVQPGLQLSFLTGMVDQVNHSMGTAVVSGVTVDYTALLSRGAAPKVGEMMSVSGRVYGGRGMVAEK